MLVRDGTGYLQISHAMFLVRTGISGKCGVYHGIRRSNGPQDWGAQELVELGMDGVVEDYMTEKEEGNGQTSFEIWKECEKTSRE
jgi:hypothetical protein